MHLLLDMDGVVADFDAYFWQKQHEHGWESDIDDPADQIHRYATDHLPRSRDRRHARRLIEDEPGWFRNLPVMPGAKEGVEALLEADIRVTIVTKPIASCFSIRDEKAAWLNEHFPELLPGLTIAPDKSIVVGDILLDDAPKPKWFDTAPWKPVIFAAGFNSEGTPWADLPRWEWGDPIEDLTRHATPVEELNELVRQPVLDVNRFLKEQGWPS